MSKSAVGAKTLVAYDDEMSWGNLKAAAVIGDLNDPAPNTLTKECEILNESIVGEIGSLVSQALNPARAVSKRVQGTRAVGGEIAVEFSVDGFVTFMRHAVGKLVFHDKAVVSDWIQYGNSAFSTAGIAAEGAGEADGTNPYVIVPRGNSATDDTNAALKLAPYGLEEGLTVVIGRDAAQVKANMIEGGGTQTEDVYFCYTGMKINSWTMNATPGEIVNSTFEFMGRGEWLNDGSTRNDAGAIVSTSQVAAPVPSYKGAQDPFTGFEGKLTMDGVEEEVLGITFTLNNNLAGDKYYLGSQDRGNLPEQDRSIEGTITLEFKNTNMYRKFLAGVSASLSIQFVRNSAERVKITFPKIEFGGRTPTSAGKEAIVIEVPFVALWHDSFSYTSLGDVTGAGGTAVGTLPTDIIIELVTASDLSQLG